VDNDPFALNSWYFRNALVRANYRNVTKGVDYSPIYLERFFRNLLLGEQWDLKNRYLHIHPTPEWSVQPNLATPTSTPDKLPDKSPDKFSTNNLYIKRLVKVIGHDEMTIKDTLKALGLKDRESFMNVYLTPAMKEQFVSMKYPHSPRHPRQRYLLTLKGQMLYQQLAK
jgi:ribosomal protein L30/L7E